MTLIAFNFDETLTQSDPSLLIRREYDVANEVRDLVEQGYRKRRPSRRVSGSASSSSRGCLPGRSRPRSTG